MSSRFDMPVKVVSSSYSNPAITTKVASIYRTKVLIQSVFRINVFFEITTRSASVITRSAFECFRTLFSMPTNSMLAFSLQVILIQVL
jgi:hypothetical protein